MVNLTKWSNIWMKKIAAIEIESMKCTRIRSKLSSCTKCMDVCPIDGISIRNIELEINDCLSCGLCTAVCPTNALKWTKTPPYEIVKKLERLIHDYSYLTVRCSKAKDRNHTGSIEVPCLGMLPWEFWIHAGELNVSIYHPNNLCSDCEINKGEEIWRSAVEQAERYMGNPIPILTERKDNQLDTEFDSAKRGMLQSLLQEVKQTNHIAVKEFLSIEKSISPQEKYEKMLAEEQLEDKVQKIKSGLAADILPEERYSTDKRALLGYYHAKYKTNWFLELPTVTEGCTLCNACAILCPNDALAITSNELVLYPDRCTQCRLCEEVCFDKHIKLVHPASEETSQDCIWTLHTKEEYI